MPEKRPAGEACKGYGWLNPFRYACILSATLSERYCYGIADVYWFMVSKLANCFDAYPCYVDEHPWIPCI